MAAATATWGLALVLWLLNRALDGLDGALARRRVPSDLGAMLDFLADFVVYGGFVVAVAIAVVDARVACAALLASYLGDQRGMMRAALKHPISFLADHRFTRTHASDYLDNTLDPRSRARVDGHTHVCPACVRLLNTLRHTVRALHVLATPSGSSISDDVLSRLRAAEAEPHRDP